MSKVWFITGSGRGLGLELAKAVLAKGDRLVATARNTSSLRELAEQHGDRVRVVALDVTDAAAAREAVAEAVAAFGRLDVVVNNAGYANVNSLEDVSDEDFRTQYETTFFGVYNVTRAALPVLRKQRSGHIIQISSIGGRMGTPGMAAYQAAKWAIGGLSEVLAAEVAHLGIRVTIAEPGGMRTDWAGSSMRIDELAPDYRASVGAMVEHLRGKEFVPQSDPARIAKAILAISEEEQPPLHLLLGSDAVFLAGMVARRRAADDARWKALSLSTDYDGLVDFAGTKVAKMIAGG